ncbi:MAG: winged helix-turn-helix domain-containing protein [Clostridia bacterium]|nr:winged helix-turn-helix domain-containing protein [Clostridia bacterium]
MGQSVRMTMMGSFHIFIDERRVENPVSKSRKGTALMEYLVLHRGASVTNQQLMQELWPEHSVTNPENALKTLVSRMRLLLNQMYSGLGSCIVSDRGAYHWQSLPGMAIDAVELLDLFDDIPNQPDPQVQRKMYQRVLELYQGDLYQTGDIEAESGFAQQMHSKFLSTMYGYIELLRKAEDYNEICAVCRSALEVDSFDDRLHIELMKAMISLNRTSDALVQYKHATNLTYRYLGTPPSPQMSAFYQEMNKARQSLKLNLEAIREELHNSSLERGAFVCDYEMFKSIYSLEMRNLERLGTTMFLGIIMIGDSDEGDFDSMRQDSIMNGLIEILRDNLRKGDIITHFSPSVVALLLPTVNYQTGSMVMERIRKLFYQRYPNSDIPFHSRLGLLGKDAFKVGGDDEDAVAEE